jgi:hypothetical protein
MKTKKEKTSWNHERKKKTIERILRYLVISTRTTETSDFTVNERLMGQAYNGIL